MGDSHINHSVCELTQPEGTNNAVLQVSQQGMSEQFEKIELTGVTWIGGNMS